MKSTFARIASLLVLVSILTAGCIPARPTATLVVPTTAVPTVSRETPIPPTVTSMVDANTPTVTPAVPTAASTSVITPSLPTPGVSGPVRFPNNVNPLTGLPVQDPSLLNRRPVMVKIANFPREGRPHAGLSQADMVFDYFIGEGANRFLALYYGQDDSKVGPMRSGRLVDAQLVPQYQGILGFESADARVREKIFNALGIRAIIGTDATCPAICDDGSHTVTSFFANTAELSKLAAKRGVANTRPNLDGMVFDAAAPTGEVGDQLTVQFNFYNRGEWRFDRASGKYLRWIESVDAQNNIEMIPLVDRNTDQQLAFSNVVVLFAEYIQYAPSLHDITTAANTKGQKAILFRDGKAIQGVWKSQGADKPLQFFLPDGKPMPFKPGNSWLSIVGLKSTTKQPATGQWLFTFALP